MESSVFVAALALRGPSIAAGLTGEDQRVKDAVVHEPVPSY
jgi:hypothetical protein